MGQKESEGERAERIHNEGQEDGAEGKYDPPHSWFWNTTVGSDQDIEDNKNYDKGYKNGKR